MDLPAHSKIGASSSKRWLTCPGSIALSRDIPNRGSTYAMEGTAAHQLAEMCLNEALDAQYYVATNSIITVRDNGAEYPFPVTQEMADAVQVYLDFVRDGEPFDTLVEVKFHLKDLHEGLFGTADCVQWFADEAKLRVIDYKHGQGTPVEAVGNPQGMYYALGALTTLRFPARVVEIVIVQPRCPHADGPIRSWTIGVDELLDWQADLLDGVKRVERASEFYKAGDIDQDKWELAYLAAGDHCKFCPAAGVPGRCSAIDGKQQALARVQFEPLVQYDPVKLAQALNDMPAVEARIKAIREFAYAEAEAGRAPPGWKLVDKRATRKWRDETRTMLILADEFGDGDGVPDQFLTPQELRSPAQIEKLLPKDQRKIIEELTVKESSGHTLAPAGDKRAAVKQSAQLDFIDV